MNEWKNTEELQKIEESSQSSIFKKIIEKEEKNDTLVGLLIHGSFVDSKHPNDIDVIIVSKKGKRHFEMILNLRIPIEIEYVPQNSLYLPLTNFHWYTQNWEYEIAKYVYGKIVYDPLDQLQEFIAKAGKYPLEIAQYLFLHRMGRCIYILRKIEKPGPSNYGQVVSFMNMFTLMCLAIERKIPQNLDSFSSLSKEYRKMIEKAYTFTESFHSILHSAAKEGYKSLELDRLFERRKDLPKFWYLAEVEGARLMLRNHKIPYLWPEVVHLEDL